MQRVESTQDRKSSDHLFQTFMHPQLIWNFFVHWRGLHNNELRRTIFFILPHYDASFPVQRTLSTFFPNITIKCTSAAQGKSPTQFGHPIPADNPREEHSASVATETSSLVRNES